MNVVRTHDDECKNGRDLEDHHGVISFRRLADAAHQNHRQNHDHQECGEVETKVETRGVEKIAL